jgi:YgjP-like, metallopeptidase domain
MERSKTTHLLQRHHDDRFVKLLDRHMPQWRYLRDQLNVAPTQESSSRLLRMSITGGVLWSLRPAICNTTVIVIRQGA